jgi:acetylornithine deacetylase/succinyl-diaminopimelate desuccinylase-like protein
MISLDASVKKLTSESAMRFRPGRQARLRGAGSGGNSFIVNLHRDSHSALDAGLQERAASATFLQLGTAVARIERGDAAVLAMQMTMAAIPAPTGHEAARALAVHAALSRAGCTNVTEDDVGNVIARLRPPARMPRDDDEAPVVCLAHLDTVFPLEMPLVAARDGDQVTCPGIGDNGRGLAAFIALAAQLAHPGVRGLVRRPIELVATVGEEGAGNLRGARRYFDARDERGAPRPHAVLVLDGPGDSAIVHHAIASERIRIHIAGPGGHSWVDRDAPSAISAAALAVNAIGQLGRSLRHEGSITVTRIGGGESLTSIPQHAWFDVDTRARTPALLARARHELRRSVAAIAAGLQSRIELLGERPGGSLDDRHPLVVLAQQATRWRGVEPVSAIASTDANIPLSRGIPAITIGAGGTGGGAHTAAEWYDNRNGPRGIARALGILTALAAD